MNVEFKGSVYYGRRCLYVVGGGGYWILDKRVKDGVVVEVGAWGLVF